MHLKQYSLRFTPLSRAIATLGLLALAGTARAGDVKGVLTDPASGKPAADAVVRIASLGLQTRTDADGSFVLHDVAAGRHTVQARLADASEQSGDVTVPAQGEVQAHLQLRVNAAQLEKVVVVANRNQATRAQLAADNTVSLLSADDLSHTAVHNAAEALGLLPGVNVVNTGQSFFGGIDGASRGEGMFTSVRGLNAEYNVNMINGVTVAQGMPYSRGVQLSLLPPSGLQTVALNKTSTADMDGDAIGGTIDYRTPTAFDFKRDFQASLTVSGNLESRARDYDKNATGGGVAADVAGKFGSERRFGIYAGAYYDVRHFQNSEMGAVMEVSGDSAWARPVASDAKREANPANLDPATNLMTTGFNVGVSGGHTERYGMNLALDWHPDDNSQWFAKFSYARADTEQNSTLSQILGTNVSYTPMGTSGLYQPVIGSVSTRFWYETNPEVAKLSTLQLGGNQTLGALSVRGSLFYSEGENNRPNHIEISARPAQDFAFGGSTLATYDADGFPVPLLTSAMLAQLNNIGSLPARRAGQLTEQYSRQKKGGARVDFQYDIGAGLLDSMRFGLKYTDSKRDSSNRDWTTDKFTDGRTFGSLGIFSGSYAPVYPGKYGWSIPTIDQDALFGVFRANLKPSNFDSCGSLYDNNLNCNTQHATEAVTAGYVQANLVSGKLEIVPGLRVESTTIRNTFWVLPRDASGAEQPGAFSNNRTRYNEPLPSVFLNYRPDGNAVYRAGLWTSYTRPAFVQLGGGSQTSISADGTTTIVQGNPDLKPIRSLNLDLSGEWDNNQGSHLMLAGFYKRLSHYIYESGSTPVNPITSTSGPVKLVQPTNGGSGRVMGLEFAARQSFKGMPAPFDGMGVGVNLTRQTTRVDLGRPGMDPNERIQNAPDWMGNLQFFYEKNGLSFDVTYHATGAYVASYDLMNQGASWDNLWVRPLRRVDLHLGYKFEPGLTADLSVANLLKNHSYWSHIGRDSLALSDIVDSGRTAALTLKKTF